MKKFIISLFLAVAAIATSHSQLVDALQEHLKFKGVPINGSLQEYVTKMKTAGFTLTKTEKDFATLQGDFAGFKNCKITVATIKPMDLVNTINVAFPSRDEWSELESDYRQLKTMLQHKYGAPSGCVEKFDMDIDGMDVDGMGLMNVAKIMFLMHNQCTWYTAFHTRDGDIRLSIEYKDNDCFVQLDYYDRLNSKAVMQQAIDDL